MSSFSGTALNLGYRSAKWWLRDSGYFSRIGISPPAQSMDDWPQFDGWLTRPPTLACSVPNSQQEFGA